MKRLALTRPASALVAACLLVAPLAPAIAQAVSASAAEKAANAYLAGARAVDRKNYAEAQAEFARAAALDPGRQDYALALSITRGRRVGELVQQAAQARLGGSAPRADALIAEARAIDPNNELVVEHTAAADTTSARAPLTGPVRLLPPIQIVAYPSVKDLKLNGDVHQVVTEAARQFGVKVFLDDSVVSQPIRFDLPQTTYAQAMPILLKTAHLFGVAVDAKTLLVAKDTQENRDKYERQVEETIFVPASTPERLNELTNVVKNVFDIKQALVSATQGTLILRAPMATIQAVNATVQDLLEGEAQVVLDIRLMTVDKNRTRNTGAQTPTAFGAFSVAAEAQSLVTANQSILQQAIASGALTLPASNTAAQNLLLSALFLIGSGLVTDAKLAGLLGTVGGGLTLLGINSTGITNVNLALNTSDARALDDLTVRVGDGETTTLRVGEKYPVTTSTYSSGLSATTTSALAGVTVGGVSAASLLAAASTSTIPIVSYEDLGITLKTTPSVLRSGLVAVKLDLKIESLTGASLDNIPILTSSNFVSTITLQDGSTAMMLSDLSSTEQASISGIPGLSELPGFRQTLADTLKETDRSELVLMVTPHVVKRRSSLSASRRIAFSTSVPQEN